ncbi:RimK/LysX family protein [Botrimarina sp.]|uniref:ATP-dependent zinc protease family protein n=1 Tax=Botrimarina sp. TaxID=2795802 RepID=UPI0032EC767E
MAASVLVVASVAGRSALYRFALQPPSPQVLGETTVITEETSGVAFTARVDTGAAVSSVHVGPEDMEIVDASAEPAENVAKTVRLRLDNGQGTEAWVETRIEDYVEVRSANGAEHRYRVRLPLKCGDIVKESVVNLKDRSNMTYKFLLGRDFIEDDFLVDVSHSGPEPFSADESYWGG